MMRNSNKWIHYNYNEIIYFEIALQWKNVVEFSSKKSKKKIIIWFFCKLPKIVIIVIFKLIEKKNFDFL